MSANTSCATPNLATSAAASRRLPSRWACYVIVGIIMLSAALVRLRLRDMPLERDEGEYAYVGQLMLHGTAPYRAAYSMKLPGTYVVYACILGIFGQTPAAVHEGLILVNAATLGLLALLAARLFGWTAAMVTAASYALLSLSPSVLGFAGHATHFVVLPALGAALLLSDSTRRRSKRAIFLCGLLLGLAWLMKQPGILFAAFAAFYLLVEEVREANSQNRPTQWLSVGRSLTSLAVGVFLPFLLTCLLLWRVGVFPRFWFWTFTYAREYAEIVRLADGARYFWASIPGVIGPAWPLWILAAIGLTAFYWNPVVRARGAFVLPFLGCSFVAVCAGLYFRQHYFILLLPALSLLIGGAVSSLMGQLHGWTQMLPLFLFCVAWGLPISKQRDFLFHLDPVAACRSVYGINPFPEAIAIADYIRSHSAKEDRIAVLGSEPEIPFYANRVSATGYIYTYGLMEHQAYASHMQREMADEIEAARPLFLLFVGVPTSWLPQAESDRFIFDWGRSYIHSHYELVGLAEILPRTEYHWDVELKNYQRHSPWAVEVYRRVD